jgi:hypothetical protein
LALVRAAGAAPLTARRTSTATFEEGSHAY